MATYVTWERNGKGYRVYLRTTETIDGPSDVIDVDSRDAAHALRAARGAVYVKNFKAATESVRLPISIVSKIRVLAAAHNRTIVGELKTALDEYIKNNLEEKS